MTCSDAREQLSLLLDDALTGSGRHALEGHLAGCGECRRELEQLRGTVGLLRHLPPAHAPAGFVDRVMAEVSRPPWPRRVLDALFRPLRVKLPLEAAAALLVAVSALHVYQRLPEVQQVARQEPRELAPAPPAPTVPARPPSGDVTADVTRSGPSGPEPTPAPEGQQLAGQEPRELGAAPATPSASPAAPAGPPPSADVTRQASRSSPATRPSERVEVAPGTAREKGEPAPPPASPGGPSQELPAAIPATPPPGPPEVKKEAQAERRPDGGGTGAAPAPPGKVAQSAEPSPARDPAGARAAAPPAAGQSAAPSAAPPAPTAGARSRAGGVAGAPSPAPATEDATRDALATAKSRTARLTRAVDASGRLTVPAREPAEAALDALLGELGATRVARRVEGPQALVLIDVVVPGARYRELIEGLGRIGRWVTDYETPTLPAEIRVEVALTAEP